MSTLTLLFAGLLLAQNPEPLTSDAAGVFPIWPGAAPGSENWTWREQTSTLGGNRMTRNIVTPTLTMYRPAPGTANGTSVIIAPGGAFRFLMVDYEGVGLARWLTARGITAFVFKYRVMRTPEDDAAMQAYLADLRTRLRAGDKTSENPPAADNTIDEATRAAIDMGEEDGRQAIRYVRAHAAEWSLDPRRIGILGFSAGGGVVMGPVMRHDDASRPDFAAPIYPAGKPAELHVFHRGGHGFGMKTLAGPSDQWAGLFYRWLESSGFVRNVPQPVSRMYIFGDSYSDTSDTGAGYLDGNGPTAAAYFAQRLGLKIALPRDAGADSMSLNFAVSGAQTGRGAGRKVKDALLGRGMMDQVEEFAARVESGAIRFDPSATLFFLAGGLNDRKLPDAETAANLKSQLRQLYSRGARRFLLATLPTAIPAFREVGLRLNPVLESIHREMEAELPGAILRLSCWGEFFDEVMRSPAAFGIENTTDACAGRAIFDQPVNACANPHAYYYYHAGHPSTAVHKVVGEKLYAEFTAGGIQ
jgi:phospholipase/lecithinase/hemolysin